MDNNRPKTPTTTTGCSCTERCKCCDAPERIRRYAPNINENVRRIALFPDIQYPGTPPYNTRKTCPGAPKKKWS